MKLIKLTNTDGARTLGELYLQPDHITSLQRDAGRTYTVLRTVHNNYNIMETPEQVLELASQSRFPKQRTPQVG